MISLNDPTSVLSKWWTELVSINSFGVMFLFTVFEALGRQLWWMNLYCMSLCSFYFIPQPALLRFLNIPEII